VILQARAVVVPGDDIDTDVLYPGEFLSISDVSEMTKHLFEGLDPTLRDRLGGDTALVVGANFGAGSSREHVPQAMRASGIRFVLGRSFARIFYRNCINLGLPALIAPEAAKRARPDSRLRLDLSGGTIEVDDDSFPLLPLPPFMTEMFRAGGLVPWMRAQLSGHT
jgi:3-isopropylmalate/(R)-2-methylmalate dehydratase small subunit